MFASLKLTLSPRCPSRGEGTGRAFSQRPELLLFVVLLGIFNLPLFFGSFWRSMASHSSRSTTASPNVRCFDGFPMWWRPAPEVCWFPASRPPES